MSNAKRNENKLSCPLVLIINYILFIKDKRIKDIKQVFLFYMLILSKKIYSSSVE